MKKEIFGKDDIRNVYQFMELCGLHCERRENIYISHRIMLRKLALRSDAFPSEVEYPRALPFALIDKELVKQGFILLVKDDYGHIIPYYRPRRMDYFDVGKTNFSDQEREDLRSRLLEEFSQKEEAKELRPGYMKYLYRRDQKLLKEEEAQLAELIQMEQEAIEDFVTEKINRGKVKAKKFYYR